MFREIDGKVVNLGFTLSVVPAKNKVGDKKWKINIHFHNDYLIGNSVYDSEEECKKAIRYYLDEDLAVVKKAPKFKDNIIKLTEDIEPWPEDFDLDILEDEDE